MQPAIGTKAIIDRTGLQALLDALGGAGYRVLGPRLEAGAILYDDIASVADLPEGWTDRQEAGRYRVERRADRALFGYAVGPHSWRRFLQLPKETVFRARRTAEGFALDAPDPAPKPLAFIGVRACEIQAIAVQDHVFLGAFPDAGYAARRQGAFIVAVNCGEAGGTCFCVSMQSGPQATRGFDLALTELGEHAFLLETGSESGGAMLARLPHRAATAEEIAAAAAVTARTAAHMGRSLDTAGIKELLQGNLEHPRWDAVAERCLACANCTLVCPTCFCSTVEDHSDLAGETAERVRRWDSCFTLDHSYLHGGSVRPEIRGRYRQWMTHKLAHWIDQFGESGCVGCGRCITWCPVGIDITEEAAAIRATDGHADGRFGENRSGG
jgi:ferredoxin